MSAISVEVLTDLSPMSAISVEMLLDLTPISPGVCRENWRRNRDFHWYSENNSRFGENNLLLKDRVFSFIGDSIRNRENNLITIGLGVILKPQTYKNPDLF